MKCNQQKCEAEAVFRFTWPGEDEAGICENHVAKLRLVANHLGLHLQLIPLPPREVEEIAVDDS